MTRIFTVIITAALTLGAGAGQAEPVNITQDTAVFTVPTPDGGTAEIRRNPDNDAEITGEFARTSRPCPPFCIQPMSPAEGVTTVGELELMEMLADPEVIVIDSRTHDWYARGTIPGAVHIPYTQVTDRLDELGCEADFDGWDCTEAARVAMFCNGNWCGQSPSAIRAMIAAGYPAERISYYRGGMQAWQLLGLTVSGGGS